MNVKYLVAALGGAVVAGWITFAVMKTGSSPGPAPQAASVPSTPPSETPAEPKPEPPAPVPAPVKVGGWKRSPVGSPVNPKAPAPKPEEPKAQAKGESPKAAPAPPPANPEPKPEPPKAENRAALEPPPQRPSELRSDPVPPPPPAPVAATVTIPSGTVLNVRLNETLSSKDHSNGDAFSATLTEPLVVDGFVIAERGARLSGRVLESDAGGKVKGRAYIKLALTQLNTADGQRVEIQTVSFTKEAESSKRSDAAKIGAGAAIGAVIGGIAGGGKGAGIGAASGGAAGTGAVLLTRGKPAVVPVETRIAFRLDRAVTLTEKLK
jgi:hypothetical protein